MVLRVTVVGGTGFIGRPLTTDKVIRDPQSAPSALGVRRRPLESFLSEPGKHYSK